MLLSYVKNENHVEYILFAKKGYTPYQETISWDFSNLISY